MHEYEDRTIEALLETYVLAKKVGAESICEAVWKQMVEYDREQTKKALTEVRERLDEQIR